ncbi:MAG TPA: glycosyltransferase, partial [Vicinamibacterales bacterium]|nr:glycosyltransferase [Vicinamibacterales bacterium]
ADRVFAVSEEIARRLRDARPNHAQKVEVLHLGVPIPVVSSEAAVEIRRRLAGDGHLVVTLARLRPQKALHVMIDALALVPDATLAILGDGPLRDELIAQARAKGIAERVHLLGFRTDAAEHIAAADVFCLSSIWEGVPLAAQEAVALGVPVVATDVGGMRELIANKITGRLVPPNDPEGLARALREVLGSSADRERYARAAKAHLDEEFSVARMLERVRVEYVG